MVAKLCSHSQAGTHQDLILRQPKAVAARPWEPRTAVQDLCLFRTAASAFCHTDFLRILCLRNPTPHSLFNPLMRKNTPHCNYGGLPYKKAVSEYVLLLAAHTFPSLHLEISVSTPVNIPTYVWVCTSSD